jgi:hypothetical protein
MWRFTRNNRITEGSTTSGVAYGFRNFKTYPRRVFPEIGIRAVPPLFA